MKYLFIHQNFPGQYLHLAQYLRAQKGNIVVGVGQTENINSRGTINGMATFGYPKPQGATPNIHHYLNNTEAEIRRGQAVVRTLATLKQKGFVPDVISVHPGWGEALFVRDMFPNTPIVMFCEFFFEAGQADLAFDAEFPYSADWFFSVRVRNASQLISLPTANVCICPTTWQTSRYPWYIQQKTIVLHDGIDTHYMSPQPDAFITLQPIDATGNSCVLHPASTLMPGQTAQGKAITLTKKDKVVTYIARNLEPYRGFHCFMRALPLLQAKHPDAHILIVGGEGASYSPALPENETYKQKYIEENKDNIDFSHVHFLGKVPYAVLRAMFAISSAHVYLTYPFVLSWSMLEAMACEALIIGSNTAPVQEVIVDGENGLLVDFFSREELVHALDKALEQPQAFTAMRKNARKTVVERYELGACLAKHVQLLHDATMGKFPLQK